MKLLTFCAALWPVPHNTKTHNKPKQTPELHVLIQKKKASFTKKKGFFFIYIYTHIHTHEILRGQITKRHRR